MVQLTGATQTASALQELADAVGAVSGSVSQVCVELENVGRCRVRVARETRGPSLAVRPLGVRPPTLEEIGRDRELDGLRHATSGLVLVSGGAASGRTWTTAALLQAINGNRAVQITTIESPVEHVNYPQPGFLSLLSVPSDFPNTRAALEYALACGAGVIAIGDLADRDVVLTALEAASAGTLVIGVMRSTGALDAVEQLVALAGPDRERTLKLLSTSLRASVYQTLVPNPSGGGLVASRELMMGSADVTPHLLHGRFNELRDRFTKGARK
jgi:twitching motility protein PilT